MSRILRLFTISLFIIGFPLGSWYYLNKGYNYRMSVIAELDQQLGQAPPFELTNQRGKLIDNAQMRKNVVVANFLSLETIDQSKEVMHKLYNIQDQFDKKDDILFYTYVKADSLEAVKSYCSSLQIKEEKQWHFLSGATSAMEQFIQAFPMQEGGQKTYAGNPTVAIIDTSSTIRYFYNMNNNKEVSKLIEHIANLMPQAPPEEARMKRELEK